MIRIVRKLSSITIKVYNYLLNSFVMKVNGVRCGSFRISGIVCIKNSGAVKIGDNFRANLEKIKTRLTVKPVYILL